MDKRPIGIFDSGLGGLSAVKTVLKYLPNEDVIYFGDSGRAPYGTRSKRTIERYAKQDIEFLQKFDCKLIMAACGTVSSVACEAMASVSVPFVEVVTPACSAAVKATENNKIGVMGTSATINSGSYKNEIYRLNSDISVTGVSCPLLVSLVENNWIDGDDSVVKEIIKRYLAPLAEKNVDTIILGCTHFPHLAPIISKIAGDGVKLIDTGYEAGMKAKEILSRLGIENESSHKGDAVYYVSDKSQNFSTIAKTLMGIDISDKARFVDIQ